MLADVALGKRAEYGIGQCVQGHIGIGVADEAPLVGNRHSAKRQGCAGAEGMDVVTGADADIAELKRRFSGEPALGRSKVGRRGELDVGRFAGDDAHGKPGPFGDAGIVSEGEAGRCRPLMRLANRAEIESLWRFGRVKAIAGDGGADLAAHEKFDTPPALLDPSLRRR